MVDIYDDRGAYQKGNNQRHLSAGLLNTCGEASQICWAPSDSAANRGEEDTQAPGIKAAQDVKGWKTHGCRILSIKGFGEIVS